VMHRWTALNLAIEHGWGGTSSAAKAEELYANLLEWFYTCKGAPHSLPHPPLLFYSMYSFVPASTPAKARRPACCSRLCSSVACTASCLLHQRNEVADQYKGAGLALLAEAHAPSACRRPCPARRSPACCCTMPGPKGPQLAHTPQALLRLAHWPGCSVKWARTPHNIGLPLQIGGDYVRTCSGFLRCIPFASCCPSLSRLMYAVAWPCRLATCCVLRQPGAPYGARRALLRRQSAPARLGNSPHTADAGLARRALCGRLGGVARGGHERGVQRGAGGRQRAGGARPMQGALVGYARVGYGRVRTGTAASRCCGRDGALPCAGTGRGRGCARSQRACMVARSESSN